jgi:ATP-dependent helicase/nuclease subunit B
MQPFLHTVATELYHRYQHDLYKIAIVFPNRRQCVFFNHYLSQIVAPPALLPEQFTIQELLQRSSVHPIAGRVAQSFVLYQVYSEVMQKVMKEVPGYEKFAPLADILLRDFDELDAACAQVEQVYSQLRDIEAIEKSFNSLSEEQQQFLKTFWSSFSQERTSNQQERFLILWENLPRIYHQFHRQMEQEGLCTQGMAYRRLAQNRPSQPSFGNAWQQVAFVGFNAFNKAEETWLQRWHAEGKCSLWLDADAHYVQHLKHEAGLFIRRATGTLGLQNQLPLLHQIAGKEMPVHIMATQGSVMQAKLIQQWRESLPPTANPEKLAIILADEALLLPVLQSLPSNIGTVNITMGYPVQQTALFSFIELFFEIQEDLQTHQERDIEYRLVQRFLQHALCNWEEEAKQRLQKQMVKDILLRVPLHLVQFQGNIGDYFFTPVHKTTDVFGRLLKILAAINGLEQFKSDELLQGFLVQVWQLVMQLQQLFLTLPQQQMSLSFLAASIRRHISATIVPFEGEPLHGLQIMGLLESRGLDFDHILILGANEGILPHVKRPVSFLPDNIRRAFKLPLPEQQDAIAAYHFYRLLHRCQSMTLAYNTAITEHSTGELTRFVPQLAYETKFKITETGLRFNLKTTAPLTITIAKSPEVMKLCNAYFVKGNPKYLSPSAINTYLTCRLQFYYRYLAGLKEPDEMQDEVDAAVFGSVVHKLMELLYQALLRKNGTWDVLADDVKWMQSQIDVLLPEAFRQGWRERSKTPVQFTGRLLIVAEVVKQYAKAYLDYDALQTPFKIEDLETTFREPFYIQVGSYKRPVVFGGYIDRVDNVNGVYRMVDYKTGADDNQFGSVESLFDRSNKRPNKAALQTLIYAWNFRRQFPQREQFEPVILPLRKMQERGEAFVPQLVSKTRGGQQKITAVNINATLDEMEGHLRRTLEELFDIFVPFDQTTDVEKCRYCPYNKLCRRG